MSIFPNFFLSLSTKLQNGLKVTPESSIVAGSQKKKYIFLSPGILKRFRPEVVKNGENVERNGGAGIFLSLCCAADLWKYHRLDL